jgi:hypothetical protein
MYRLGPPPLERIHGLRWSELAAPWRTRGGAGRSLDSGRSKNIYTYASPVKRDDPAVRHCAADRRVLPGHGGHRRKTNDGAVLQIEINLSKPLRGRSLCIDLGESYSSPTAPVSVVEGWGPGGKPRFTTIRFQKV